MGYVVKREAEVATQSPADQLLQGLTTFFQEADVKVKEMTKSFLNIVGVQDEAELKKNIETKAKSFTQTLQEKFADIQTEAEKHTGNYRDILTRSANALQQQIQELQAGDNTLNETTKKFQVGFSLLGILKFGDWEFIFLQESFQGIVKNIQSTVETLKKNSTGVTEAFEKTAKEIVTETEAAAADVKKAIDKKSSA